MANLNIQMFGGMVPRLGVQRLPNEASSQATNTLLLSGELRGIRGKKRVVDLRSTPYEIKRVYRIESGENYTWVTFDDETVDFVKGPLVNDDYDRYYWTSENTVPMMNTRIRMENDLPPYILGIPQPVPASPDDFTVVAGTGTGPEVTRAYVYTYVSTFGEEGPPIAYPASDTGPNDATWTLSGMTDGSELTDLSQRALVSKKIYRTITGANGVTAFHYVDTVALATATYDDSANVNTVGVNPILDAHDFFPPPENLIGIVAHPNGFLVGFDGRDLHFSEPYRPHAWPGNTTLSTQDTIKGLGVYATSIAVCTTGFPYIVSGIRPDNMSFLKAQTAEPCVSSRRGIVPMPFGVYYPSDNGLVLVSASGFKDATKELMSKTEWQGDYFPSQLVAARWDSQYVAFYDSNDGFMFAPDERTSAFVELGNSSWEHSVIQNDLYTGDVYMVRDNVVYEWNPPFGIPQTYTWTTKEFVLPKPVNFGACAIDFGLYNRVEDDALIEYVEFNEERYGYPLAPLCFKPLATARKIAEIPNSTPTQTTIPEVKQAFCFGPLYNVEYISDGNYRGKLALTVEADGLRITSFNVYDAEMYRLPAGYKARRWRFTLSGNVNVRTLKVAETGVELGRV